MSEEIKWIPTGLNPPWEEHYQRGRADMLKEMLGGEPDGYAIAWEGKFTGDFYKCLDDAVADFGDSVNHEIVPVKLIRAEAN